MRKDQVRVLVGVVLTLAIVVPLGWMWWDSRLPSSYSVLEMGEPDWGGGPRPAEGGHAHGQTGGHTGGQTGGQTGGHAGGRSAHGAGDPPVSVVDLDTSTTRPADVVVELTARQGKVTLASGEVVDGYTFNGTSPGPTITATVGQLVEVRVRNASVRDGISLHWHGVDVPNAQDGVAGITQDAVMPGEEHTYRWVAPHVGTYWYHSHQLSHAQVLGGLLGGIVIEPRQPEAGVGEALVLAHLYRGLATLNGSSQDLEVVAEPGQRMRVRLVNTDNGPMSAWTRTPYLVRAVDGYDVHEPTPVTGRRVAIPAGGKVDLEVRVPEDGTAVRIELTGDVGLVLGPPGAAPPPRIERPERKLDLLSYGTATALPFDPDAADRRFEYSIGRRPGFVDGKPGLWWSVNGKTYPDLPMAMVQEGDVARMTITNNSNETHPMHLHGHHAVVLSRDGKQATGSPWWFDTLDVRPDEEFEIAFLADNPGIWMDHCHNLEHAADGMVSHLMYTGVTTPFLLGDGPGNMPE